MTELISLKHNIANEDERHLTAKEIIYQNAMEKRIAEAVFIACQREFIRLAEEMQFHIDKLSIELDKTKNK